MANDYIDAVFELMARNSIIILINGLDLSKLDMNIFSTNTYFVPNAGIERGEAVLVKDEKLKLDLFKFCQRHINKVAQGKKEMRIV